MKKYIIFILFTFFYFQNLFAQIGIYPYAVFLDTKNRSGNIKVMNNSTESKEINIELKFGYSGYDSLGRSIMVTNDSITELLHSAVPYVKAYPKKLILKPSEEQIIRFMVGNIAEAKEGTYYCRVFITSKMPPEEIDTTYSDSIKPKIDIQFTLIAAVIFQKGNRNCSLELSQSNIICDSNNVDIIVDIKHSGNSPFLGTSEIQVFNKDGSKILSRKEMTPVYHSTKKAFTIPRNKFTKGRYQVEITMSNEHKDVPDGFKTPIEPVKATFTIDLTDKL